MAELLLKIRFAVKRMFTPILQFSLAPLNYDVSFVIKAFLNRHIQCGDTYPIFISLGLKIGDPGDSRY